MTLTYTHTYTQCITTLSHSVLHSCHERDKVHDIWQHMVDFRGMLPTDWPQSAVPATCGPGRRNDLQIVYSFVRSRRHPSWAPRLHFLPLSSDIFHTTIFTRVNQYLRRVHWSRPGPDSRHADDSRYCRITGLSRLHGEARQPESRLHPFTVYHSLSYSKAGKHCCISNQRYR